MGGGWDIDISNIAACLKAVSKKGKTGEGKT